MKIKIPKVDNSALLVRSSKVMMCRCLNPNIQYVDTFIFRMLQFWNQVGWVSCLNLGNTRFQSEFQAESDLEIGEEMAKETVSSKKVRRPLFQAVPVKNLVNSDGSSMAADVPVSYPTLHPDSVSMETSEEQGILSSTQLDVVSMEGDESSNMVLLDVGSGPLEDSIQDTIAFEAVLQSRQHLTEAEKSLIHEEFAAKLQQCKDARIVKPPLGAGKPVTRASTPFRCVCTKKLALI